MKRVSIYCLINPITKAPFYVGATSGKLSTRLSAHITESKTNDTGKSALIADILSEGCRPTILLLNTTDIQNSSFWEDYYMEMFRSLNFYMPQPLSSCYTKSIQTRSVIGVRPKNLTIKISSNEELWDKMYADTKREGRKSVSETAYMILSKHYDTAPVRKLKIRKGSRISFKKNPSKTGIVVDITSSLVHIMWYRSGKITKHLPEDIHLYNVKQS